MEGGSLFKSLRRFGMFPEQLSGIYIYQALEGLKYLHANGILHRFILPSFMADVRRDIKSDNMLVNKEGKVKLADFGSCSTANNTATMSDAVAGTPYWMAPEVVEVEGCSAASDIWSIGCTTLELLQGYPPFYVSSCVTISHKLGTRANGGLLCDCSDY